MEPKLAPPGAGIPWPALLFCRFFVNPFVAGRDSIEEMRSRFDQIHLKIRDEFLAIPEALREEKVLVPRQRGLEDSSRYWSAAMVLEHLEIVGTAIAAGIVELGNDRDPGIKADTAQVKPKGIHSAEEIFVRFEKLRTNLLPNTDSSVKSFDFSRTLEHPWFGQLTARKWYWLLGIHGGIHLQQIRAIRAGLAKKVN